MFPVGKGGGEKNRLFRSRIYRRDNVLDIFVSKVTTLVNQTYNSLTFKPAGAVNEKYSLSNESKLEDKFLSLKLVLCCSI